MAKRLKRGPNGAAAVRRLVSLTEADYESMRTQAEAEGLTWGEWARQALDRALLASRRRLEG